MPESLQTHHHGHRNAYKRWVRGEQGNNFSSKQPQTVYEGRIAEY